MASEDFDRLKKGIDAVVFVYINMHAAIDRWVTANTNNPTMVARFEEDDVEYYRPIHAHEVVESQDYIEGAALVHLVMQLGRILDAYLKRRVTPLIKGAYDDTWFSLDAVELISGVKLMDVMQFNSVISLGIIRAAVDGAGPTALSGPQVLDLARHVTAFAEDFDARFDLEQEVRRTNRKAHKQNEPKLLNEKNDTPAPSGVDNRPHDIRPGSAVHSNERTDGPRYSNGPTDFIDAGWEDSPDPTDDDHGPEEDNEYDGWAI